MKRIVIDSNRVIAALLKESTTRKILLDSDFEFFAPEFINLEINNHKSLLIGRADIKDGEFDILLSLIFEHIVIIPSSEYEKFTNACANEINDENDIPYLAACLAINAEGVWTHDPHFKEQKRIKVFTNIDMLNMSRN